MVLTLDISEQIPDNWNKFLLENISGNIYNSKEYATYSPNEDESAKFLRITNSKGEIKLQTLLLEKINSEKKIKKVLSKFSNKFSNTIKWNYGPISSSNEATDLFFKFLKKSNAKIYGITHPLSEINQKEFHEKKWGTYLIDLSETKDEIFSKMDKKSGRKNIERSIERGVKIEKINEKSLLEYIEIYNLTKKSGGGNPVKKEIMQNLWEILKPAGFSGYIARKDGICIGGMLFSFFNGYINEWGVARTQQDFDEKLYSQDLIKWKIIQWGVENKMRFYDLTGFNPNPETNKEKGILRYKKKWGGKAYDEHIISN